MTPEELADMETRLADGERFYTAADMREAFISCISWILSIKSGSVSIDKAVAEALRRWPDKEEK